jgi:hypothetical protein
VRAVPKADASPLAPPPLPLPRKDGDTTCSSLPRLEGTKSEDDVDEADSAGWAVFVIPFFFFLGLGACGLDGVSLGSVGMGAGIGGNGGGREAAEEDSAAYCARVVTDEDRGVATRSWPRD